MFSVKDEFVKKVSILYVEDEMDIAEDIYEMLLYSFENVHMAHDGEAGLKLFKEFKPDIVVTDIQMPIMDGIEMSKHIKSISPHTPIIISSAFSDSYHLKKAIDLGVSDYILKPIDFAKLTNALDQIIINLQNSYELEKKYEELELARNEAVKANEAKSMFLASMSHEIRTPLNAITGFLDIISDEFSDKKLLSYINIINLNSESLLGIINDILDFNKIESGKLDIVKEYFDIHEAVKNIVDLFWAKAEEKGVSLNLNIDENIPKICKTDPLRLKQILSNLLSNAIKFTESNGVVELQMKMSWDAKEMYFSVKDSGIGISQEYQKSIFDPFTQADDTTTKKYGGTGLGLSISYKLAALLGSKLRVRSEMGSGSEFYFTMSIECLSAQETESFILKEKTEEVALSSKHILLVEDNRSNQLFMDILLDTLGFTCEIASNGQEAVEMFKTESYDIVLMDENMPIMNGVEATRLILSYEAEKKLPHTPIIALTANALKGDRERFLAAGMDEYLEKPLDKNKLVKVLKNIQQ